MSAPTDSDNRIDQCFARLRRAGRKALVTYLTAGYPQPAQTVSLLLSLVEGGADIIELGIPFSDPMADGPVIQRASEAALKAGTHTAQVLDMLAEFRRVDRATPVVLMTYLNPIEAMGYDHFAARAGAAGADGVLVVDLPPEEADELRAALAQHGLHEVFLASPTTTPERLALIRRYATGFVYYVSIRGVTGRGEIDLDEVARQVARLREHSSLPVGVGFAVRDAQTAARLASVCDAVVVGSAIVEQAARTAPGDQTLAGFVRELRTAMDAQAAAGR